MTNYFFNILRLPNTELNLQEMLTQGFAVLSYGMPCHDSLYSITGAGPVVQKRVDLHKFNRKDIYANTNALHAIRRGHVATGIINDDNSGMPSRGPKQGFEIDESLKNRYKSLFYTGVDDMPSNSLSESNSWQIQDGFLDMKNNEKDRDAVMKAQMKLIYSQSSSFVYLPLSLVFLIGEDLNKFVINRIRGDIVPDKTFIPQALAMSSIASVSFSRKSDFWLSAVQIDKKESSLQCMLLHTYRPKGPSVAVGNIFQSLQDSEIYDNCPRIFDCRDEREIASMCKFDNESTFIFLMGVGAYHVPEQFVVEGRFVNGEEKGNLSMMQKARIVIRPSAKLCYNLKIHSSVSSPSGQK